MKPPYYVLKGSDLFRKGLCIYVNRIEEKFETGLHQHDFCELNYIAEGSGFQYLGDRVLPAARGDFFALPIGSSHVFRPYSSDKNRRLVVYNVVFTPSLLEEIAAAVPDLDLGGFWERLSRGPLETGRLRDSQLVLEPLFERIYEEHASLRPGSSAMLTALLTQILIEWMRQLRAGQTSAAPTQGLELIGEAADYIRKRASEPLTLRETAEHFRVSERHFQRLFKERTGQTFHDFVQRQRIMTACELLRTTSHKLDAIAAMAGYRDLQSFCRVFKRIEGKTPGQYRKAMIRPVN
ncbi:AraC family transcriptional regulator [Gorillibacterium massiliense]|uniref:AraC family transcriptional regulator n=1 Tax=Gorillibacterium massiliense TaxID=1280390 RepID=UPI0004BADB66|nr:AraC family transcriptional regulator [Gorillibacterium massiliense]